jgi:hypothetical protein
MGVYKKGNFHKREKTCQNQSLLFYAVIRCRVYGKYVRHVTVENGVTTAASGLSTSPKWVVTYAQHAEQE